MHILDHKSRKRQMQTILEQNYHISSDIVDFLNQTKKEILPILNRYEDIKAYNSLKVLRGFHNVNVQERHFNGTTGYGMNDSGRETLCALFADIFGTEAAIVSPLFSSGTHTICTALFGLLRPLDTLLCITGQPYDTLTSALGIDDKATPGGLSDYAIKYQQVDLKADFSIDIERVLAYMEIDANIKVIYIQRSKGYDARPAFTIAQIEEAVAKIREKNKSVYIVVDNCYGEFTEYKEPTEVGADVAIGSLIKNPGAGITPTGGYIVGSKKAMDLIAGRFTTPTTGMEIGSYTNGYRAFFQGIFHAPNATYNALYGAILFASAFAKLGYEVCPMPEAVRADIPQAINFHNERELIAFVQSIQKASPIDHNAVPYADDMPGYESKIIMASGSFIQGSTIELSADAPIRPPYTAFYQGGLTKESIELALCLAIDAVKKANA